MSLPWLLGSVGGCTCKLLLPTPFWHTNKTHYTPVTYSSQSHNTSFAEDLLIIIVIHFIYNSLNIWNKSRQSNKRNWHQVDPTGKCCNAILVSRAEVAGWFLIVFNYLLSIKSVDCLMLIFSFQYVVWLIVCFSVLFQSGRPSRTQWNIQHLQRGTMVSLIIISTLSFQSTENPAHCHFPSVHLVAADLAVIFSLWQGFTVASADHFALYQWALQSDHRRLPGWMWNKSFDSQSLMFSRVSGASPSAGLELFCTSFPTAAAAMKTSRCNLAVCDVKSISRLHQVKLLCEAETWEYDLSSAVDPAAHQAHSKQEPFASVAAILPG